MTTVTHMPKNGRTQTMTFPIKATCHCAAVTIRLSTPPTELTRCNCSLCSRYGVVWAYYNAEDVTTPEGLETDTYTWNGRNVDFHRCRHCGCITHWVPRRSTRKTRGINANLLPEDSIRSVTIRYRDGAETGKYLD
ncbi:GFA family protein [Rhizobium sp. C4]|uniref:GFA family protein n=1 Tax=Rhizobium sp. C4 TaxID=1349800 RepID=UPI003FA6A1D7